MSCPCRTGYANNPGVHNNQVRAAGWCSCECHPRSTAQPSPGARSSISPVPRYRVEISRTVQALVEVDAATPQAALEVVDQREFPLPPAADWQPLEGWEYAVLDAHGREVLRRD